MENSTEALTITGCTMSSSLTYFSLSLKPKQYYYYWSGEQVIYQS